MPSAIRYLAFTVLIFASSHIMAQADKYIKKEFIRGDDTLRYRILFPHDYDEKKKYPLVLFLHGSGERGNDNTAQLTHGSQLFIDSIITYPAIILFPQCPLNDYWARANKDTSAGGGGKW